MSSVRRSEKQTLHFGHCHLLHFSTTHTSPFLKLAQPSAHLLLAISIQTILQNDCEWRKLGKIPTKLLRGWATNNKRSRNVAGTQSGGNILRTLRSRRLRNGRITCLPGVTQVRKLGGKTKRLAVDGKTFLETAFAA